MANKESLAVTNFLVCNFIGLSNKWTNIHRPLKLKIPQNISNRFPIKKNHNNKPSKKVSGAGNFLLTFPSHSRCPLTNRQQSRQSRHLSPSSSFQLDFLVFEENIYNSNFSDLLHHRKLIASLKCLLCNQKWRKLKNERNFFRVFVRYKMNFYHCWAIKKKLKYHCCRACQRSKSQWIVIWDSHNSHWRTAEHCVKFIIFHFFPLDERLWIPNYSIRKIDVIQRLSPNAQNSLWFVNTNHCLSSTLFGLLSRHRSSSYDLF